MKQRRWMLVATAAVVGLIVPAIGQGKVEPASLKWTRVQGGGGSIVTSYDFGVVGALSSESRWFRLGNSSFTRSGKLKVTLTGSPAFSIAHDRCAGKIIGKQLSCWVAVAYTPGKAGASDSATLTANGENAAAAKVRLSGTGSGHLYWVEGNGSSGAVKKVPLNSRIQTADEVEYYKNGGILHYVLRQLAVA